jgi:antibiotic biosynthesis monooxygenase (ABM) superfamily enzyme
MKTKMKLIASVKIWIVIYPSITLFLYIFGGPLSVLPLYQRTGILTLALVPWIVFIGVPFVDLVLRFLSPRSIDKQVTNG